MKNAIEMKAVELGHDVEAVKKELKRVQSAKCLHLKKKGLPKYEEKLAEILAEEQLLKEVRTFIVGHKKTVTTFTKDDIDQLTYDETIKAIKSIQSKKYHSRWLTDTEGDNDEFREACRIEQMLNEHKATVSPVDDNMIRKSDLQNVIDTIEMTGDITIEAALKMLKSLI